MTAVFLASDEAPLLRPRVHQHVIKTLGLAILSEKFSRARCCHPSRNCARHSPLVAAPGARRSGCLAASAPRPRVGTIVRPREDWNLLDPNIVFQQMSTTIGTALARSFRLTIERVRARDGDGAYSSMPRPLDVASSNLGLSQFRLGGESAILPRPPILPVS